MELGLSENHSSFHTSGTLLLLVNWLFKATFNQKNLARVSHSVTEQKWILHAAYCPSATALLSIIADCTNAMIIGNLFWEVSKLQAKKYIEIPSDMVHVVL